MKYFTPLIFLIFSLQSVAQDKVRPGPHNKIGHSEQSQQDKENTFLHKLFNDDLDLTGSSTTTNDKTLSQIEKLADLYKRGIITEDEFNSKKILLLDKIK
jgi:hypothetical protein